MGYRTIFDKNYPNIQHKDMNELVKNYKEFMFKWMSVLFLAASLLGGCHIINRNLKLNDDHILEELTERTIENRLGLEPNSIDFTPDLYYRF